MLHLQDPLAEPNWSLSIRRSQVLNAFESALAILSGAEDAWLAWRHASSRTEAQLQRHLASAHQHYHVHDQVCVVMCDSHNWVCTCHDMIRYAW